MRFYEKREEKTKHERVKKNKVQAILCWCSAICSFKTDGSLLGKSAVAIKKFCLFGLRIAESINSSIINIQTFHTHASNCHQRKLDSFFSVFVFNSPFTFVFMRLNLLNMLFELHVSPNSVNNKNELFCRPNEENDDERKIVQSLYYFIFLLSSHFTQWFFFFSRSSYECVVVKASQVHKKIKGAYNKTYWNRRRKTDTLVLTVKQEIWRTK